MFPAAPGLLSTTTGWPHICESFWATMRPPMSEPPGAKPTSKRTGLSGHAACALVASASSAAAARCFTRLFIADDRLAAALAFLAFELEPVIEHAGLAPVGEPGH